MSREIDARSSLPRNSSAAPVPTPLASGLEAPKKFFVQRALEQVREQGRARGLLATEAPELTADPHILETSSGAVAVHVGQQFKGIPIFQAAQTVHFDPDGAVGGTVGALVTIASDIEITPLLRPEEAVAIAARHVATSDPEDRDARDAFGQGLPISDLDVSGYAPKVIAAFRDIAAQPTVFDGGPFGEPIRASLIWFPLDASEMRIAWDILITMPLGNGQYRVLVDANGKVLYATQLVRSIAVRGNVYLRDPSEGREFVDFPLSLAKLAAFGLELPVNSPADFPSPWVDGTGTEGNAAQVLAGESNLPVIGKSQGSLLVFDPTDPVGDDQRVLNLFYFNCFLHDYFYVLGFREADGNFQLGNFSRGGLPGDRVVARAFQGPVFATANMTTPTDGTAPLMNMGLVTTSGRSTALDATIVIHEFSHGVTTRLVGGLLNVHALDAPQSSAMGEGWGDYFACTVTGKDTIASWSVNKPAGIRGFRYDDNFPDNFGQIGKGRYTEIHNVGEIWAAMLLDVNRRIGIPITVQLVTDAMKLSPASPTFLDMRDAILSALRAKVSAGQIENSRGSAIERDLWSSFAKYGMGPKAIASNGAALSGAIPDYNPPQIAGAFPVSVSANPMTPIPDKDPRGISSSVSVTVAGKIQHIRVSVDIRHTYVGDLRVVLFSPDGSAFLLHSEGIDDSQNLVHEYSEREIIALSTLRGRSAQGVWRLAVADVFRTSIGTLQSWQLDMELI